MFCTVQFCLFVLSAFSIFYHCKWSLTIFQFICLFHNDPMEAMNMHSSHTCRLDLSLDSVKQGSECIHIKHDRHNNNNEKRKTQQTKERKRKKQNFIIFFTRRWYCTGLYALHTAKYKSSNCASRLPSHSSAAMCPCIPTFASFEIIKILAFHCIFMFA